MYTEEKLRRVNNVIKDMVFNFKGKIAPEITVEVDFQFQITGVKKMISVGEYYDYLTVDIKIVGGDKRFDLWMKLAPTFLTEYKMLNNFNRTISEELQYFFGSDYVRVDIKKTSIKLSEEYQEKIENLVV